MRITAVLVSLFIASTLLAQKNDIDLLKTESGNEITYYAKSNVREAMTLEMNVEGTGFTCSVPLPAVVDLKSYEKKLILKITLDPSGNSNYSVSYKSYKKGAGGPKITSVDAKVSEPQAERPGLKKGVVVFSKDGCGKCQYAVKYLKENNIKFQEINISKSEDDQSLMWKMLMEDGFADTYVQTPVILVNGKANYNMDLKAFLATLKP
ncbi:MAG: glutaredoxin [Saprospiraceae bacterium]|nr:glutaredoxin [Saprospiraceae bacterium]MBK7220290.1 glutaredoxin [Saprospiraceae bacterium]MBK8109697.1 glutaredoxin [Saprospiraceae bacterium]MBK8849209.1 glutaredoxin [Saprospiraceae bacterium]MBK9688852.1 glutaredoxin [Saprospiraceae bacterium]